MAKTITAGIEQGLGTAYAGLDAEQLVRMYRLMYLSRRTDDREILLKRQQKIFFQVSGAGHEALLVAAGMALKPGYDWFYPYYRDRALCLTLGNTVEEMLLQAVGAAADVASGGRQMPSHWSNPRLNIVSSSSSVTTQCLQAVGCAEAGRYLAGHPDAANQREGDYSAFKATHFHGDEVVYVSLGEGATSEGEFWEAMSSASSLRLPVLFVVEDNGYAISVPVEVNTPGGNISRLVANFPNFYFAEVDGTDPVASYAAFCEAVSHCRSGKGPAFVHGHVIRQYSHSFSDDEGLYRSEAERNSDAALDPLPKLQMRLLRDGILDPSGYQSAGAGGGRRSTECCRESTARGVCPRSAPLSGMSILKTLDPTQRRPWPVRRLCKPPDAQQRTMADLINACLKDEMQRDPRIVVFGQDVADTSHDQELRAGPGEGQGRRLQTHRRAYRKEFGSDRVYNARLAEADIIGRAVGMATRGLKPVVEIQFFDYIWPAMHQLRNELSLLRWRSNGSIFSTRRCHGWPSADTSLVVPSTTPSVGRASSRTRLVSAIVFPSNALDANGLLRTAIRCDDPVLFFEHKRLYRETFGRAAYPWT